MRARDVCRATGVSSCNIYIYLYGPSRSATVSHLCLRCRAYCRDVFGADDDDVLRTRNSSSECTDVTALIHEFAHGARVLLQCGRCDPR